MKTFFTLVTVLIFSNVFAQKTEYKIAFNSGLFSFSGPSSEAVTFINYNRNLNSAYTNNPYGSQQGLCYGISGNLERVSKRNFIYGIDMGYERLRSKIYINGVSDYDGTTTYQYNANGKTFQNLNFINLEPFAGYRFAWEQLNFDLAGGIDLGCCLDAKEKGSATTTRKTYKTSTAGKTVSADLRPRIQLSILHKRLGFYAGYSFGQTNYLSGYIGGINECYSRLLRFGGTWLLK
jgi:hypothetical protein